MLQSYPGSTKAQVRARLFGFYQNWAEKVQAAFSNMRADRKQKVQQQFWQWGRALQSRLESPDTLPTAMDVLIPANWADHLTQLFQDCDEYFLCRGIECGQISPHWIRNSGHFRCCSCKRLYRPWVEAEGLIPAQKALVLGNLNPDQARRARRVPTADDKPVDVALLTWPDSATDGLTQVLKTQALTVLQELRDLITTGRDEEILQMLDKIVASTLPTYLFEYEWTHSDEEWRDWQNKQGRNSQDPWSVKHLEDANGRTAYRAIRIDFRPGEDVVLSHLDVIRMWGIHRYILEGNLESGPVRAGRM